MLLFVGASQALPAIPFCSLRIRKAMWGRGEQPKTPTHQYYVLLTPSRPYYSMEIMSTLFVALGSLGRLN